MIPYEELVDALDRYVARNGGTPQSARASASSGASASGAGASAPAFAPPAPGDAHAGARADAHAVEAHGHGDELPAHDLDPAGFDEPHDPDLPVFGGHGGDEDATHVGASPAGSALPPPLSPVHDDPSNEIDIGDVLSDEDL
jgi:hypothetical protein